MFERYNIITDRMRLVTTRTHSLPTGTIQSVVGKTCSSSARTPTRSSGSPTRWASATRSPGRSPSATSRGEVGGGIPRRIRARARIPRRRESVSDRSGTDVHGGFSRTSAARTQKSGGDAATRPSPMYRGLSKNSRSHERRPRNSARSLYVITSRSPLRTYLST